MPRLFVYGTLKRGERNHARLAGARHLGPATTRDAAFAMAEYASVSRPGRLAPDVRPGGACRIAGEIYEVDEERLAALDRFERVGVDYHRTVIALGDGTVAQAYLGAPEGRRPANPAGRFVSVVDGVASWSEGEA